MSPKAKQSNYYHLDYFILCIPQQSGNDYTLLTHKSLKTSKDKFPLLWQLAKLIENGKTCCKSLRQCQLSAVPMKATGSSQGGIRPVWLIDTIILLLLMDKAQRYKDGMGFSISLKHSSIDGWSKRNGVKANTTKIRVWSLFEHRPKSTFICT